MKIDVCASIGASNLNQMPNQCENAKNSVEFGSIIKQAIGQGLSQNANAKTDDTATPLTQQATVKADAENTKNETENLDVNAESLILAQFTPTLNFVENVDLSLEVCEVGKDVTTVDSVQAVGVDTTANPMQPQQEMPIDVADSFKSTIPLDTAVATQLPTVDNAQSQPVVMIDAEQPQSVANGKTAEFDVQTQTNSTTFNNEIATHLTPQTTEKQVVAENAQPTSVKDFTVPTVEVETVETDKFVAETNVSVNAQNTVENLPTNVVVEKAVAENTVENLPTNVVVEKAVAENAVDNLPTNAIPENAVVAEQVAPIVKADVKSTIDQPIDAKKMEVAKIDVETTVTQTETVEKQVTTTSQTENDNTAQQGNDTFEQHNEFKQNNFAKDDSFVKAQTVETAPQQAKTVLSTQSTNQNRQSADEGVTSVKLDDAMHSATVNVVTTQKTATLTQVEAVADAETVENVKTQILTEIYDKFQSGINDFEIRLKPNELGEVTVKMAVKGSELVIELVAHDAKTEQIILSSSNEIKEILQTQLNQTVVIDFVDNDNAQFDYNDGRQSGKQHHENGQNQTQDEQNNLTDAFMSLMMKMQSVKF